MPFVSTGLKKSMLAAKLPQQTPEAAESPTHSRQDLVVVIVLSIIAALTAWCSFESGMWGKANSLAFSQSDTLRLEASEAASQARDAEAMDLAIYVEWFRAQADGDAELSAYVQARFSLELNAAFTQWQLDGDTSYSPISHPAYQQPGDARAQELIAESTTRFEQGLRYSETSSDYSRYTVILAMALFLGAMSQRNIHPTGKKILAALTVGATVLTALGVFFTLPIKF